MKDVAGLPMGEKDPVKRKELIEKGNELEQQLLKLHFHRRLAPDSTMSEAERAGKIIELLAQLQPLYEQLGGVYVSEMNQNYIPKTK